MNIGLGIGIPFTRSSLWASIFTPSALFLDGSTQGVWYDPSDMTSLYQDAAGTTAVNTMEQPVGLMLDKSKGLVLGPELVTNGDFSNGSTGWVFGNASWSVSGGRAINDGTNSTYASLVQSGIIVAGKFYVVEWDQTITSGSVNLWFAGTQSVGLIVTGSGRKSLKVRATVSGSLFFEASIGGVLSIDNISVRELLGNHAFNPSGNSANFPVLSARVNLLERTEDFTNAYWSKNAAVAVAQSGVIGTISVPNTIGAGVNIFFRQSLSTVINTTSRIEVRGPVGVSIALADDFGTTAAAFTGDWQTITLNTTGNGGFHQFYIRTVTANQAYSFEIRYPDFRVANDALNQPAYQRVNTATDYDTVGFKPYLRFNGVSQWLQTNSIDFSYSDKMFVCAGVRKLSDAVATTLLELSVTSDSNTGSFYLRAPDAGYPYGFKSRGTANAWAQTSSTYSAPITNVISGIGDISGDQAILRVNGTQAFSSTSDQGTGNYGNYPLYIGARAGSSLWFNGRFYQLVIAAGSEIRVAEEDSDLFLSESGDFITAETTVAVIQSAIEQTEAFVNRKTKAF